MQLAAQTVLDALADLKHATRWFPVTVVAASNHQGAILIVHDHASDADGVQSI